MKLNLKCFNDMLVHISLFLLIPILLVGCGNNKDEKIKKENHWNLVWEDNFERDNIFSTGVWEKISRGPSDWNNYMSDEDALFEIKDGVVALSGIENNLQPKDTAQYLTAGITTKGLKFFNFGRIEVCCRLEAAQGAWPAIWMLPKEGKWPFGGEIDIMERLNFENKAYQTIHTDYTVNKGIKNNPVSSATGRIKPNDYNIYAVETYPDSICFYINNVKRLTYPRVEGKGESQYPFNRPYYLLIDMQLGGSWVGKVNPKDLPVKMYIDWVRYYELEEENSK